VAEPCLAATRRRSALRTDPVNKGHAASTLRAPSAQIYERRVAPKPISTFISLETGQPAFAFAAIDWNAAWSMPGIFAVTVRWTEVIEEAIAFPVDDDFRFAVDLLRHEVRRAE
jgi:hypothetical protein